MAVARFLALVGACVDDLFKWESSVRKLLPRWRLRLRLEECIEGLVASRNGADVDGSLGRRRELDDAVRGKMRSCVGVTLLSCKSFRDIYRLEVLGGDRIVQFVEFVGW